MKSAAVQLAPSAKRPLGRKDARLRFLLAYQVEQLEQMAPEAVSAHPAATDFPGVVPTDAPRLTTRANIDTAIPGRHSLGLYAPAGSVITITLPDGTKGKGVAARIGAHSDQLWHADKWSRVPDVSMRVPLTDTATRLASPFGGLLYLEAPEGCTLWHDRGHDHRLRCRATLCPGNDHPRSMAWHAAKRPRPVGGTGDSQGHPHHSLRGDPRPR